MNLNNNSKKTKNTVNCNILSRSMRSERRKYFLSLVSDNDVLRNKLGLHHFKDEEENENEELGIRSPRIQHTGSEFIQRKRITTTLNSDTKRHSIHMNKSKNKDIVVWGDHISDHQMDHQQHPSFTSKYRDRKPSGNSLTSRSTSDQRKITTRKSSSRQSSMKANIHFEDLSDGSLENLFSGTGTRKSSFYPRSTDVHLQAEKELRRQLKNAQVSEAVMNDRLRHNRLARLVAEPIEMSKFCTKNDTVTDEDAARKWLKVSESIKINKPPSKTAYEKRQHDSILRKCSYLGKLTKVFMPSKSDLDARFSEDILGEENAQKDRHKYDVRALPNNVLRFFLLPKKVSNAKDYLESEKRRLTMLKYEAAQERLERKKGFLSGTKS